MDSNQVQVILALNNPFVRDVIKKAPRRVLV